MEWSDILSYALTAIGGGGIGGVFFWQLNKRKKVAEVKNDEIENMAKMVETVYKPMIEDLSRRIDQLNAEVASLRAEREMEREQYENKIRESNENCEKKSAQMKQQILELAAQLSRKADRAPRNAQGKFTKKSEYNKSEK